MVPYLLDRECRDSVPSTTSPGLRWYKKFDPDLELNYQPRIEAQGVHAMIVEAIGPETEY
jgi:hypothetical protein